MKSIRQVLIDMMQDEQNRIIKAIEQERQHIKLSLIEDWFKSKNFLAGACDKPQHHITNHGETFDQLIETDIETLEKEIEILSAEIRRHMIEIHDLKM